jgi:cell division protein FtsL
VSSLAYSQSKRVENLHLTRERDRRRGRQLATWLLAIVPVACALLVYAALHVETVRVGYTREARQKLAAQLDEENRRLKAELVIASAPSRVVEVAAKKGLKPPRPGQIQYVEGSSGSSGSTAEEASK